MALQQILQSILMGGQSTSPQSGYDPMSGYRPNGVPMDQDPGMTPGNNDIWHLLGITPRTVGNFQQPQGMPNAQMPSAQIPGALQSSPMNLNVQGPGVPRPMTIPNLGAGQPQPTATPTPPVNQGEDALRQLLASMDQSTALQKKALGEQNTPMQGLAPRPGAEALVGLADILFGKSRGDILNSFNQGFAGARQSQNDQAQKKASTQAGMDTLDAQNAIQKAQANYGYQKEQAANKIKSDTALALEADKTRTNDTKIMGEMARAKTGRDYIRLASGLSKDAQLDPGILKQDAQAVDEQNLKTVAPIFDKHVQGIANTFGEISAKDMPSLKQYASDLERTNGLAAGSIQLPPVKETVRKQAVDNTSKHFLDMLHFKQAEAKKSDYNAAQRVAQGWANVHVAKERLGIAYQALQDHEGQQDFNQYLQQYRAELAGYNASYKSWSDTHKEAVAKGGLIDKTRALLASAKAEPDTITDSQGNKAPNTKKAADLAFAQTRLDGLLSAVDQANDQSGVQQMTASLLPQPMIPTAPAAPQAPSMAKIPKMSAQQARTQFSTWRVGKTADQIAAARKQFFTYYHQTL